MTTMTTTAVMGMEEMQSLATAAAATSPRRLAYGII
jgi:hypothetical protein